MHDVAFKEMTFLYQPKRGRFYLPPEEVVPPNKWAEDDPHGETPFFANLLF
jgi:hypothetical protein